MRRVLGLVLTTLVAALAGCQVTELDFTTTPPGSTAPVDTSTPTVPGNGHSGPLTVATPFAPNVCHVVVSSNTGGAVTLDSVAQVNGGDALLLISVQGDLGGGPGGGGILPFALTPQGIGTWELVRVVALVPNTTVLGTTRIVNRYSTSAGGNRSAQACTVPEYSTVNVTASGALQATPWNGSTGGVVAFMASTGLTLAGAVDASGAGFRGGLTPTSSSAVHGTAAFGSLSGGYGGLGESLDRTGQYGSNLGAGRGPVGNAGGGGGYQAAGGAGGGNGGAGGSGGVESSIAGANPLTGGVAGGAISNGPPAQPMCWLGGGGGAGAINGTGSSLGGAAGGLVLLGVKSLSGGGTIRADGSPGTTGTTSGIGGGGGGAGGTILLVGSASLAGFSGTVSAIGGAGGSTVDSSSGPGGGGGGGRVWAVPGHRPAAASLSPGAAGSAGGAGARGASAGSTGLVEP